MNTITKGNYFDKVKEVDAKSLPPKLKEGYDFVKEVTENHTTWNYYNSEIGIKEVIDEYLANLSDFIVKNVQKSNKSGRGSTEKKEKTQQQFKPQRVISKKGKLVERVSEEIKFIRRFIRLHNKTISPVSLLTFIKSLQRAIVQKLIRKTSSLAKEIRLIQDKIVNAYNNSRGRDLKVEINEKDLSRLVSIAGGENIYPSILIIKRYVGLQGKKVTNKEIERFSRHIKNTIEKKRVAGDDPYYNRVKAIFNSIKKLKQGSVVSITTSELNGLEGIVKAYSSKSSLGTIYNTSGRKLRHCKRGTYTDAQSQGACSHNRGLSGVTGGGMTAEEMGNRKVDQINFGPPWNSLIGFPARNFSIMFHGGPGSGKTTLLLKFAENLANNFGNVAYISSEEYEATTLTDKINELLKPKPLNLMFFPTIDDVDLSQFEFVILDSINDLGLKLEDFKQLKKDNPETAFILVLQHTKDGSYRGGKDWEHTVEIGVLVEDGLAKVYRTRYGVKGELNFFEYFKTRPIQSMPKPYALTNTNY